MLPYCCITFLSLKCNNCYIIVLIFCYETIIEYRKKLLTNLHPRVFLKVSRFLYKQPPDLESLARESNKVQRFHDEGLHFR